MKPTHLLGLIPLLTLALAACSSSPSTVPSGSTTASTAPTTTAATAATSTRSTASGAHVTTPASIAGPARCVAAGLHASLGQSGAAAGTSYIPLLLTNRSRVTCILDGYPGVSFVAGTDAHQIGAPALRDPSVASAPVTLAPGSTVHATVEVADYANYDQQTCQPVRVTGYRIFPPGSTVSLLISAPQTVCSKPGVQGFRTMVVRNGTNSN